MGGFDQRLVVDDAPEEIGILHHYQGGVKVDLVNQVFQIGINASFGIIAKDLDLIIRLHIAADDITILGVTARESKTLLRLPRKWLFARITASAAAVAPS